MEHSQKHIGHRLSLHRLVEYLDEAVAIAPLVTFRVVFGAVMVFSTLRFWYLGWIEDHFIDIQITFKYFGFHWVELLPPVAMYLLHGLMLLGALGIMLGLFYRWAAAIFFLCFTYVELIDLTYYLNHYYFVSITSLLLILVPANRRFSLDILIKPNLYLEQVPRWTILIFKVQIAVVYIFAGLAKINYDWLIAALPLKIWLPAHHHLPLIGPIMTWDITAYAFSWIGMLYDCTIVFFLAWRPTRVLAYISVIVFHSLTGLLFQIGVFPIVMMGATWIYFSEGFHETLLKKIETLSYDLRKAPPLTPPLKKGNSINANSLEGGARRELTRSAKALRRRNGVSRTRDSRDAIHRVSDSPAISTSAMVAPKYYRPTPKILFVALALYFSFQIIFPWRYLLYPGNLFWTEEGYRFSWRVMLMEKAGTATFYVTDTGTGREGVVDNSEFLQPHQEKQMAMQPDMIMQYAHFLADHYKKQGLVKPKVRAEIYVTLNARPSRLLIDPQQDLTKVVDGWKSKDWILAYEEPNKKISKDEGSQTSME